MQTKITCKVGDVFYNYEDNNLVVVDYVNPNACLGELRIYWTGFALFVENKFLNCIKIGEL